MPITSLEIKDKTFNTRFRGFDQEEVDEFLDIVVRDYEDLVRSNHDKDLHIKSLEDRLSYFDEMKDSLSQSVLIAQDTAERVKQAATERSNILSNKQSKMHNVCWKKLSTRQMKFFVTQLTMLRKLLLKQKN